MKPIQIIPAWMRPRAGVSEQLGAIAKQQDKLMSKTQEVIDALGKVDEKLVKIEAETKGAVAKIVELQASLEGLDIPQAVLDKVAQIQGHLDEIDGLIPDAPPAPVEPAAE
jgi:hypothetical protein